uniref:Immunoglobulin C1-set domain-containing protein n=1 Tax=Capra hircus TaxID=9925 RepID=A0A8C2N6Y6_CAPHI
MLLLPLLLLVFIIPGRNHEGVFQEPTAFYLNQISTYAKSIWIHDWESDSYTAIFLKPRCKSSFSDEEMTELEDLPMPFPYPSLCCLHFNEFTSVFPYTDPFGIQVIESSGLHSGKAIGSSLRGALGGLDFVRIQNHSCVPAPDSGSRRQKFCALMTQYQSISNIIEKLISSCQKPVLDILGVLDAVKAELQRQVKPEAWMSSGPISMPGCLLLVCHVSGFYPKPQEQPGTQQGDIMPSADWTWYLRVTLNVSAGEAAGLSCQVKHSSLGDQDIILHLECSTSIGLILVAIILPSLILLICLMVWRCW